MNSGSVPYSDIRRARQIKKYRSELKKDLKRGKIKPAELFIKRDIFNIYIANMKLLDIVLALPGFGRVKAEQMLKKLKINPCKKIKGLGCRQKKSLADFFGYDIFRLDTYEDV